MTSEERHELQRNDLATGIHDLPGLWKRHGNKLLLVVAVAFLVIAAVRYKRAQAANKQFATQASLASAWNGVGQLPGLTRGPQTPEIAKIRSGVESEINQAVQVVADDTDATPAQSAWAWLARGELYWQLAHVKPATETATTAPASQPAAKTPGDYLALASGAYTRVISDYSGVALPTKIARFSLAAIAEEDRKLDDARKQYKALIETVGLPEPDKSMAEARLAKLATIDKPVLLLPATQPALAEKPFDPLNSLMDPSPYQFNTTPSTSQPTTQPATTQPQ